MVTPVFLTITYSKFQSLKQRLKNSTQVSPIKHYYFYDFLLPLLITSEFIHLCQKPQVQFEINLFGMKSFKYS